MKILVCVKQVPDAEAPLAIAGNGFSLAVAAGDWRMNRFDEFAIEEALRIREACPGTTVEALSVGPPRAADVLRRALSLGVDGAIHLLCEKEPAPLPGQIAAWIAASIRDRGYDLILTGVMSEDAMQGQVGPILAELSHIPCATTVIAEKILAEEQVIRVERELEGGLRELLEMPLPALITVQSGINRPRYPALSCVLRARTFPLLTIETDTLPEPPRRERVVSLSWAEPSGRALILTGTPAQKAAGLAELFAEKGLL